MKRKKYKWKQCIQSDFSKIAHYRRELQRRLPTISPVMHYTKDDLCAVYMSVVAAMVSASDCAIPQCVFRKNIRPKWKGVLKTLHDEMRSARKLWVQAGKPRSNSVLLTRYKECKRTFRAEIRRHNATMSADFYNELDKSAEVDQNRFWRLLKASRRKPNKPPPPMCFDGTLYHSPLDITNKWAEYFENLYTPKDNPEYDKEFKKHVEARVRDMDKESYEYYVAELDSPFTVEEVKLCIRELKNGKAGGYDNLSNEHIKCGGKKLHETLTDLFNLFLKFEYVPKCAKRGIIHTLYKGNGKKRNDPNSYRPVTLLPVLYKLFERLMLGRLQAWISDKNIAFPNPQQSAYQRNRSCVSTSFVMMEAIYHQLEKHSKVYACFLDTKKAYDTVWHNGLLYKLFNFGIKGKLWRLTRNCYDEIESCVVDNELMSPWFVLGQGVRQGGVLSTWLYLLYINEQLEELDALNVGIQIDGVKCGSPCHADDLTLLSIAKFGLDTMMHTSYRYAMKWRYDYNGDKCSIIVFGESANQWNRLKTERKFTLGKQVVMETTSYVHLGQLIDKYLVTTARTISAAQKLKSSLMSILGPGLQPQGFNPITSHKLYKLICIPRALYGSELWTSLTANEVMILERSHRYCLKRLQGFNRQTRTLIVLAMIGSPSLQIYLDRQCMRFLGQLAAMDSDCLPKQVLIKRFTSAKTAPAGGKCLGYIPHITATLDKYNCGHVLEELMLTDSFPNKAIWKKTVYEKTALNENLRFLVDCESENLQRTLRIEKTLDYPSLLWIAANQDSALKLNYAFLAKLCTIVLPTGLVECAQCSKLYADPHVHFFCECTAFSKQRELFWDRLVDECSVTVSSALWNFPDNILAETLLGRQTLNVDIEDNLVVLKIAAECWYP